MNDTDMTDINTYSSSFDYGYLYSNTNFVRAGMASAYLTVIICVAAIFENAFVIFTVCCIPNLRKKSSVLIVNLAVVDLISGCLNFTIIVLVLSTTEYIPYAILILILTLIIMLWSLIFVLAASLERFLAVAAPVRYGQIISTCRLTIISILLWLLPVFLVVLPAIFNRGFVYIYIHCALTLSVVLLYILIFVILKRKSNRHEVGGISGSARQTRLRSLFFTFGILVCSLIICLLPIQLIMICYIHSWVSLEFVEKISAIMLPFLMLNSALNPIIYWWRIPKFREGYKNLARCHRHQKGDKSKIQSGTGTVNTKEERPEREEPCILYE
ncbi:adenosine receptor A3-like [Anneissia japonica]|uniref:adenosine receptor A3-like n=1 Tax=Anneissia japonica TaxID=1529436 RepID=UPI00142565B5|nr:adenosine receptor A3-like [Anneissia japonica]